MKNLSLSHVQAIRMIGFVSSLTAFPKTIAHFLCGVSSRVKLVNYISGTETFGSDKSQVLAMVLSYVRVVWRISLSS